MQTDTNSHSDSFTAAEPPEQEDARWEARVLTLVLAEHPGQWREEDLIRELLGDSPEYAARDNYERAVDHLIRLGVLYRSGGLVLPTRATIHIEGLPLS